MNRAGEKWAVQDSHTPSVPMEKQGTPQAGAVKDIVVSANSTPAGDFATAVQAIMGLPLSDGDKAEAIRRLLQGGSR